MSNIAIVSAIVNADADNAAKIDLIRTLLEGTTPVQTTPRKPKAIAPVVAATPVLSVPVATPVATPKAPRTPRTSRKSADKAAWRSNKPSNTQVNRVERCEEAILMTGRKRGIVLIVKGADRKAMLSSAGNVSDYYNHVLTPFTKQHGIKF